MRPDFTNASAADFTRSAETAPAKQFQLFQPIGGRCAQLQNFGANTGAGSGGNCTCAAGKRYCANPPPGQRLPSVDELLNATLERARHLGMRHDQHVAHHAVVDEGDGAVDVHLEPPIQDVDRL